MKSVLTKSISPNSDHFIYMDYATGQIYTVSDFDINELHAHSRRPIYNRFLNTNMLTDRLVFLGHNGAGPLVGSVQ